MGGGGNHKKQVWNRGGKVFYPCIVLIRWCLRLWRQSWWGCCRILRGSRPLERWDRKSPVRHETHGIKRLEGNSSRVGLTFGTKLIHIIREEEQKLWLFVSWILQDDRSRAISPWSVLTRLNGRSEVETAEQSVGCGSILKHHCSLYPCHVPKPDYLERNSLTARLDTSGYLQKTSS